LNNDEDAELVPNQPAGPDLEKDIEETHKGRDRLRTGLLMLSSALLGGIAFAIWNRRQISNIQQAPVEPGTSSADDDAIY
jgi:hypothetical protein